MGNGPTWLDDRKDPQIRADLDRQHPERLRLRVRDLAGLSAALNFVGEMWAPPIARARAMPTVALHQRVGGEYSFVETQRHLLFASDAWLIRMVLRTPDAFHEWGVPPEIPLDRPHDTGPERMIDCFRIVLAEEWWHHQYAMRDLATLDG